MATLASDRETKDIEAALRIARHRSQTAEAEAKEAQKTASAAQKKAADARTSVAELEQQLRKATSGREQPLMITDHAALRFVERHMQVDFRTPLAALDLSAAKAAMRSGLTEGNFQVAPKLWAIMKDSKIVTFIENT